MSCVFINKDDNIIILICMKKYLIGYDIGSSSVKASLVEIESGRCVASSFYPKNEAPIIAVPPCRRTIRTASSWIWKVRVQYRPYVPASRLAPETGWWPPL